MLKLNIVYEDKNILVINKPAGLIVHPKNKNDKEETLTDLLLKYYSPIKNVGDSPLRPGIVHRLDKNTSGLMVVAKNQKIFEYIKNQFKNRILEKKYFALVKGTVKNKKGIIATKLGKYRGKQTIRIKNQESRIKNFKEAVTEYKVIKRYKDYTLLEVSPKTGRTHQIRVHLASIGHPIICDKLYGGRKTVCPNNLNRHFLHAFSLKFNLPNGKIYKFESEMPEDLNRSLPALLLRP